MSWTLRANIIADNRRALEKLLPRESASQLLLDRYDRWAGDLYDGLVQTYDVEKVFPELLKVIVKIHSERSPHLLS